MSDMRFLITVMCKLRDGILLAAASVICLTPSAAQSQYIQDDYLRRQMQALGAIKDTVNAICYTVKQEGQTFQGTLSGDVKAKLENAMSTVKDLKLDGSGQVRAVEYHGVVQEALASTLQDSQSCKRSVFDRLVVVMVPSVQDS